VGNTIAKKYCGFRFEVFWPRVQGYNEVVQQAWEREVTPINPFLRLHIKLQQTGAKLRQWSRSNIGNVRLLLCAAKQLIGILDVVHEFRQLSTLEVQLKRDLKACFLGSICSGKEQSQTAVTTDRNQGSRCTIQALLPTNQRQETEELHQTAPN
jgi:hypothetical protein